MNEVSKGDGEKEVDGSGQVRSFKARSLPFFLSFFFLTFMGSHWRILI